MLIAFGSNLIALSISLVSIDCSNIVSWRLKPVTLPTTDLGVPLAVYLGNFGFATIPSLAAGIYIPILLGLVLGVAPILILYQMATTQSGEISAEGLAKAVGE